MPDLKITIGGDAKGLQDELKKSQAELGKTAIAAQKLDSSLANSSKGFSNIGSKAQIASTALTGLGNAAGEAVGEVTSLGNSLLSGGITIAIPIIISGLFALGEALFGASKAEKALAEENERVLSSFSGAESSYVKAVETVENLRIAFKQAEDGVISQNEAVKLYNDTIGKTTGSVKTLGEAEQELAAKGDAYIKFTLLKAAANVALTKSSEKLFASQLATQNLDLLVKQKGSYSEAQDLKEAIKKFKNESDSFLEIQKDFVKQSEEIAVGFGFTGKGEKDVSGIIGKIRAKIKELQDVQPGLLSESEISKNVASIKKLQDELDRLLGKANKIKDVKTISDVLSNLRKELDFLNEKELRLNTNEAKGKISALDGAIKELITKFGKQGKDNTIALFAEIKAIELKEQLVENSKFQLKNPIKIEPVVLIQPKVKNTGWMKALLDKNAEDRKAVEEWGKRISETIQNTAVDAFVAIGEGIGNAISGKNPFGQLFSTIFKSIGAGLKQLGTYAIATSKLILALKATIGTTLGIVGGVALIALGTIISAAAGKIKGPAFATGVRNFGGGTALVGERGPELVQLPTGSNVVPNGQLNAMSSGGNMVVAEYTIRGQDLAVVLKRANQTISRNG